MRIYALRYAAQLERGHVVKWPMQQGNSGGETFFVLISQILIIEHEDLAIDGGSTTEGGRAPRGAWGYTRGEM